MCPPRESTPLGNPLSAVLAGRMWAGEKGQGGAEGVQLGVLVPSLGYDHRRGIAGGWEGEGSARGAALAWGNGKCWRRRGDRSPVRVGSPARGPALAADGKWSKRMLELADEGWELTAREQMRHDRKGGDNLTGLA